MAWHLIGAKPLQKKFSEILMEICTFSMHLKMLYGKCRPFCMIQYIKGLQNHTHTGSTLARVTTLHRSFDTIATKTS